MNYFEIFDLPVSLYVDPSSIREKFYALSRKFHPDYYAQSSATEQAEVLENSSLVNKAYKVFQDPDETIRYVLLLKNLMVEEEKYQLDPAFLMEVMEINEELMEADEAIGLAKTRQKASELLDSITKDIQPLIKSYVEGRTSEAELRKVKDYYYRKKYIQRILDAVNKREQNNNH